MERMNGIVNAEMDLSTYPNKDSHKPSCLPPPTIVFLYKQFKQTLLNKCSDASRITKRLRETLTREQLSLSQVTSILVALMCLRLASENTRTSKRTVARTSISHNTLKTLLLTANATLWALPTEVELTPTASATIVNAKNTREIKQTRSKIQTEILSTKCPDKLKKLLLISFLTLSNNASRPVYTTWSTGRNENDHFKIDKSLTLASHLLL